MDWIAGSAWRYFTLIFLLSLAIRVNQLNQLNRRVLVPTSDRELGAIAISLTKTGEFANTFIIPSGPTAHLPPVPPLMDSLICRAFLIPLATYPLIYYFVAYMPRYRVPIDWILYILAGTAVWQLLTVSLDLGLRDRALHRS
jgi:hypothetical protein